MFPIEEFFSLCSAKKRVRVFSLSQYLERDGSDSLEIRIIFSLSLKKISRLSFPPVVIHQPKTQFTFKYRFNETPVVIILKCIEILSHYVVDLELIVL